MLLYSELGNHNSDIKVWIISCNQLFTIAVYTGPPDFVNIFTPMIFHLVREELLILINIVLDIRNDD